MAHKVKQFPAPNRTEYLTATSKEKWIILFTVSKSSTYYSGIMIIKKLRTGEYRKRLLSDFFSRNMLLIFYFLLYLSPPLRTAEYSKLPSNYSINHFGSLIT